jgi:hypothetical protein
MEFFCIFMYFMSSTGLHVRVHNLGGTAITFLVGACNHWIIRSPLVSTLIEHLYE